MYSAAMSKSPVYGLDLGNCLNTSIKFSMQIVLMIERELLLCLILSKHLGTPLNQCLKGLRTANPCKSFLLPYIPEEHDSNLKS